MLNAIASIAAADLFQIDAGDIQSGFTKLKISAMRMERVLTNKGFLIINDAWNASPVSMKAAIDTIANLEGFNKKVLVLGDMLELGDKEFDYHIEIAQGIDPAKIHSVFTFGDLSEVITDTLYGSFFEGTVKHFTSKPILQKNAFACLIQMTSY